MRPSIRARAGCRVIRGYRRLREERGAALIEIMVAATLTAMVATGVYAGLDGATAVSNGSKSRAIAAAIAQDDQERLRAVPPAELVDKSETRTVSRAGVQYTVASSSRWVADRDSTPDCNTATSRTGYLRILSRVTWPDMRGSRPVVVSSLVAPPNGTVTSNRGAIGIKVLDNNNNGVSGVSVSVSGLALSGTTNSDGCVYWDDQPQGNYSYTASKGGYVDHNGNTSVNRPIGVAGGQTRLDTIYLAPATTMDVQFVTRRYGGAETNAVLPESMPLNLAASQLTQFAGVRVLPSSTSSARSVSGLFPMQYGVYGGNCVLENNPAQYGSPFVANPPFPSPVKPYLPALNIRARRLTGVYLNNIDVRVRLLPVSGSTCTRTNTVRTQNVPGVGDGAIANPEFPYGRYEICAEAQILGIWYRSRKNVDNLNPAGTTGTVGELTDLGATTGRC